MRVFYPEKGDNLGLVKMDDAIKEFEPDVVYATGEPGLVSAWSMVTPARIPFVAYIPIEGEPIIQEEWRNILHSIDWFTCSKYGVEIAKRDVDREVDYVYHGVDHDVFHVDDESRERTRRALGWDDKFVVMTVAANVRRKQHPRLFEAIAILRDHFKQNDIILYDHTVPYQRHWLDGWNLPVIAKGFGVHEQVLFNPKMTGWGASVPETASDLPGLADLYRAADLFVLPSQMEGFGLPIAEAMASGVPVAVTKYSAGWEVASPAGYGLPVKDWEIGKQGMKHANVDPFDIAKAILTLKRDPKRRARMRAAGLERVKAFQWPAFQEKVVDAIEKAREAGGFTQSEPDSQAVANAAAAAN